MKPPMRKMLATAAVVLLFALGASLAGAGIDEGGATNKRGDHATAVQKWRALAERDNATAQYILGFFTPKAKVFSVTIPRRCGGPGKLPTRGRSWRRKTSV